MSLTPSERDQGYDQALRDMVNGGDAVTPIPAEIAIAIAAVKKKIKQLEKTEENTFDNYKFVSVDAIYEAVRLHMADAGLDLLSLEDAVDTKEVTHGTKAQVLCRYAFQFILIHTSGKTWTHPKFRRTVPLRWAGAQTMAIAQSYAEKAILRSIFKIATGETDADESAKEEATAALVNDSEVKARRAKRVNGEAVGRIATLVFKSGPVSGDAGALVEASRLSLAEMSRDDKKHWAAQNQEGIEALMSMDKPKWLALRQMIES